MSGLTFPDKSPTLGIMGLPQDVENEMREITQQFSLQQQTMGQAFS